VRRPYSCSSESAQAASQAGPCSGAWLDAAENRRQAFVGDFTATMTPRRRIGTRRNGDGSRNQRCRGVADYLKALLASEPVLKDGAFQAHCEAKLTLSGTARSRRGLPVEQGPRIPPATFRTAASIGQDREDPTRQRKKTHTVTVQARSRSSAQRVAVLRDKG